MSEYSQEKRLLSDALKEILLSDGRAAKDRFSDLRQVDRKVREAQIIIGTLPSPIREIADEISTNPDFEMNSRRIRLEALADLCKRAMKMLDAGLAKEQGKVIQPPDISTLVTNFPDIEKIIGDRWIEAQMCQNAGAYLASVIMMGSILEGLLLARATLDVASAYQASRSPKGKKVTEWKLGDLIDVAVELGWIKSDRGKFSHALRESRNVVHPWNHARQGANFDEATCKTCWQVLNASVQDLIDSLKEGVKG